MVDISPFTDKINTFSALVVAILSFSFGKNWFLFVAFLICNALDYVTRWRAARLTHTENSGKGWTGILKKLGYWVMILVAFLMSAIFVEIGNVLGINLQITTLLGYFVLGSLLINELRSILENLVDAGDQVPWFLIKGLEVADDLIDKEIPFEKKDDSQ